MNKFYINLIGVVATSISLHANAEFVSVKPWFKEDPKYIYYYIETDTSPNSMEKYMSLQLKHGWEIDLTGFSGQSPVIRARFKRERSKPLKKEDTPFPNSPSWYNAVLRGTPTSYQYSQGVQEAYNHLGHLSKQGFEMGLMKQPLDLHKVTITYFKER